jgi:hypothetical protein
VIPWWSCAGFLGGVVRDFLGLAGFMCDAESGAVWVSPRSYFRYIASTTIPAFLLTRRRRVVVGVSVGERHLSFAFFVSETLPGVINQRC